MFLQHRATALLRLLTLAMLIATFATALPATAQTITVYRAGVAVTDLILGNNLNVAVSGAQPNTTYKLSLFDEDDTSVSEKMVHANAQGDISILVLWARSGVVGCDEDADPDPLAYRFQTFELAETLAGRTFRVALTDLGTNLEIANSSISLVASTEPRFYHSDGAGCPRFEFRPTETIYIAAIHLPLGPQTHYRHWATWAPVDPNGPWPPSDVRPSYPNGLNFSGPGTTTIVVVDSHIILQNNHCVFGTVETLLTSGFADGSSGNATMKFATGGGTRTGDSGAPPSTLHKDIMFPAKFKRNTDPSFNCPPCVEFP